MISKNSNTVATKNRAAAIKTLENQTNVNTTKVNTSNVKRSTFNNGVKVAEHSNVVKKKPVSSAIKTTSEGAFKRSKPVPLKATVPISKSNVMNKVHNVTVSSPPVKKKDVFGDRINHEESNRERTKTRTLEPHEVVILRNIQDATRSNPEPASSREMSLDSMEQSIVVVEKVKNPVSFEINFGSPKIKSEKRKSESELDDDYEDDFESYESDFESGSSSKHSSDLSTSPTLSEDDELCDNSHLELPNSPHQNTVDIVRDESKLDSGNYDLHGGLVIKDKRENPMNSIEEDSGIDNFRSKASSLHSSPPPPAIAVYELPIASRMLTQFDKRGQDLMKKIHLDTINFQLFELKPMTYEYYMKIYGNIHSIQNSTQTNEDVLSQDTQTDDYHIKSTWTQFPPRFSNLNADYIYSKHYYEEKRGVGDGDDINDFNTNRNTESFLMYNKLSKSVFTVKSLPTIDHDRLNMLLQRSSLIIFEIIDRKRSKTKQLQKTNLKLSYGYNVLQVSGKIPTYGVYTNHMIPYTFVTVHESMLKDYTHVASVWTVSDQSRPIQNLSSWSRISCIEIHPMLLNVVFAGLNDGSLAAWDLKENAYWHSQTYDENSVRVPSQIVIPSFLIENSKIEDFGRVVAVKSVALQKSLDILKHYNPIQVRYVMQKLNIFIDSAI